MVAPRPTRRDPEPPRTPAGRPDRKDRHPHRGAIRDAIAIAVLSILVAVAGGFTRPINLVVALMGGITAAVILYKELRT